MKSGTAVSQYFGGIARVCFGSPPHPRRALGVAPMIGEFTARVDGPVHIVGEPAEPIARESDSMSLMAFPGQRTYSLSARPLQTMGYGFGYEERWKT